MSEENDEVLSTEDGSLLVTHNGEPLLVSPRKPTPQEEESALVRLADALKPK